MGKIRARSSHEFAEKEAEIIEATKRLLSTKEYYDISLASIAEETSLTRQAIYSYFKNKESIFVEILYEEYWKLEVDLSELTEKKLTRKEFCRKLADVLWERLLFLKLLSFQIPIFSIDYDKATIDHFMEGVISYRNTLDEILLFNFPESSSQNRNIFCRQFMIYCNSLYTIDHPKNYTTTLYSKLGLKNISPAKAFCIEGLTVLSSVLVSNNNSPSP